MRIYLLHNCCQNIKYYKKAMIDRIEMFKAIGLSENKAKETIKNAHISQKLEKLIYMVTNE